MFGSLQSMYCSITSECLAEVYLTTGVQPQTRQSYILVDCESNW